MAKKLPRFTLNQEKSYLKTNAATLYPDKHSHAARTGATTLSIMAFSIMTLSIMTLSIMIFSITIKKCATQHNST